MSSRPDPLRATLALALALAAFALAALPTVAFATSYTLVSSSASQQAEDAQSPAVSSSGRYIAFAGEVAGVSGVFRKDLQTGELALVAGSDSAEPALSAPDAGAPSISADGQYVSFTTTTPLVAGAQPSAPGYEAAKVCSNVYVRDMAVPIGQRGAYVLASALDGSEEALAYAGGFTAGERCPGGGAAAATRGAISESGSEVVFTIDGSSDLTGACTTAGTEPACPTPPAQVAVRDLEDDTTTLVSQTLGSIGSEPLPVPDGAALTDDEDTIAAAPSEASAEIGDSTATISADGTTVAWMGIEIPKQAPASAEDEPRPREPYEPYEYDEPLWRRIAAGADAPTRRVIGEDEPLCGCAGPLDTQWEGTDSEPPNKGPSRGAYIAYKGFASGSSLGAATPQLSANGQAVALLSTQPATGEVPVYTHGQPDRVSDNAYLVNMAEGLARDQALTRLTAWPSNEFDDYELDDPIDSIAISPAGTQVAFTTSRIIFPYSPPALVTPELSRLPAGEQLYLANLPAGTLQMLSYGYESGPANENVTAPVFDDESALAFASGASNLVYGAFNSGGSDVFLTPIDQETPEAGTQSGTPLPPSGVVPIEWVIGVSTRRGAGGKVLVEVSVPGAGALHAAARASVAAGRLAAVKPKSKDKGKGKGKRKSKHAGRSAGTHEKVLQRTVASAAAHPAAPGIVQLVLSVGSKYRALEKSKDGLYCKLTIAFAASGHATLTKTIPLEFRSQDKRSKAKPAKKRSRHGRVKRGARGRATTHGSGKKGRAR